MSRVRSKGRQLDPLTLSPPLLFSSYLVRQAGFARLRVMLVEDTPEANRPVGLDPQYPAPSHGLEQLAAPLASFLPVVTHARGQVLRRLGEEIGVRTRVRSRVKLELDLGRGEELKADCGLGCSGFKKHPPALTDQSSQGPPNPDL